MLQLKSLFLFCCVLLTFFNLINVQGESFVSAEIEAVKIRLASPDIKLNEISLEEIKEIQGAYPADALVALFIFALKNEVYKYKVMSKEEEARLVAKNQIIALVKYIQNNITDTHRKEFRELDDIIESKMRALYFYENYLSAALAVIKSKLEYQANYLPNSIRRVISKEAGYVSFNGLEVPQQVVDQLTQEAAEASIQANTTKDATTDNRLELNQENNHEIDHKIENVKPYTDAEIEELQVVLNRRIPGLSEVKEALVNIEQETSEFGFNDFSAKPHALWFLPLDTKYVEYAVLQYIEAKNFPGAAENNNMVYILESMADESARANVKGSGPSFIGADNLQAFTRWIVKNSNGKYIMPPGFDPEINSLYYEPLSQLYNLESMKMEGQRNSPTGALPPEMQLQYESEYKRILSQSADGRITDFIFRQITSSPKPIGNSIFLNPFYKEGEVYEGYRASQKSGLVIKLDGWSSESITEILLPMLTAGKIELGNSANGVPELKINMPIFIISEHAAHRLAAKNHDGTRFGEPLSHERLIERARQLRSNIDELKQAILAQNSLPKNQFKNGKSIPEALLRAVPSSNWIVPTPLNEEELKQVAEIELKTISAKYLAAQGAKRVLSLTWDSSVVEFVVRYKQLPEDQTQQLEGNISDLITASIKNARKTFLNMKTTSSGKAISVRVQAEKNPNGTYKLAFYRGEKLLGEQDVARTLNDQVPEFLSPEEVERIRGVPEKLKLTVKGVDEFVDKIAPALTNWLQNAQSPADEKAPTQKALTILAAGLSSGGKSYLGEELARLALPEGNNAVLEVFLNRLQTKNDFDRFFYGVVRDDGVVVESDFMKMHRMYNGAFMIRLEEFTNAKIEIQIMFYDFLRKQVVVNFADNKPRYMGKILIYGTANRTEEFYKNIPKNIPKWQLLMARLTVFEELMSKFDLIFDSLTGAMTEATVLRFDHIGHFGPLDLKSIREIIWLELEKNLKVLRTNKGAWAYDVQFASVEDYMRITQIIELEGYEVLKNAASVTSYVNDFVIRLKALIESKGVLPGAQVILRVPSQDEVRRIKAIAIENKDGKSTPSAIIPIAMEAPTGKFTFNLPTKPIEQFERENLDVSLHTAAHEIGHVHARQRLLGAYSEPGYVTTLPEVVQIGDEWIRALGVAYSYETKQLSKSLNFVLREMARLLAGQEAERLVTVQNTHTAGKSNDTQRATDIAYRAVLHYGLVSAGGIVNRESQKYEDLSEDGKKAADKIVEDLMWKARYLANLVIESELTSTFIPLVNRLAEKRVLTAGEIKEFYANHPSPRDYEAIELDPNDLSEFQKAAIEQEKASERRVSNDLHLRTDIGLVESLVTVEEVIEAKIAEMVASAIRPERISVLNSNALVRNNEAMTCRSLFH